MGVVILSTLNCSDEKQLRTKIRQLVLKHYPEAIAGLYQNYGIISDSASFPLKKRLVVLIHGLDDACLNACLNGWEGLDFRQFFLGALASLP